MSLACLKVLNNSVLRIQGTPYASLLTRKQHIRHVMNISSTAKQMRMMAQKGRPGETNSGMNPPFPPLFPLLAIPPEDGYESCGGSLVIRFHMTPHPISSRMGFHYDGILNVCPLGLIRPCHGLTLLHRDPLHTTLGDNVTEKVLLMMPQHG